MAEVIYRSNALAYVDFTLYLEVAEEGFVEAFLAKGFAAVGDWTGCWAGGEDAVDAGGAHFVVTFWVDEKLEGGIEVAVRCADGADIVGGVVVERLGFGGALHGGGGGMGRGGLSCFELSG